MQELSDTFPSKWGVLHLFQNADGLILALKNFCKKLKSFCNKSLPDTVWSFHLYYYQTHRSPDFWASWNVLGAGKFKASTNNYLVPSSPRMTNLFYCKSSLDYQMRQAHCGWRVPSKTPS